MKTADELYDEVVEWATVTRKNAEHASLLIDSSQGRVTNGKGLAQLFEVTAVTRVGNSPNIIRVYYVLANSQAAALNQVRSDNQDAGFQTVAAAAKCFHFYIQGYGETEF